MRGAARVLLLLGLIAAGLAPAGRALHASPSRGAIVVYGARTSYVDIRFDRPFLLDEIGARMSYSRDYAGWFLHRRGEAIDLANGNTSGSYALKDFAYPGQSALEAMGSYGMKTEPLDPGRYRLYLITDGYAEVTIPIREGAEPLRLRPRRATSSDAAVADLTVGPAGLVAAKATTPVRIKPSTLGVTMVTAYSEAGLTVENLSACFAEPEDNCSDTPGAGPGYVFSPSDSYSVTLSVFYDPGTLTPGGYEATQELKNAGSTKEAHGAHLVFDLAKG